LANLDADHLRTVLESPIPESIKTILRPQQSEDLVVLLGLAKERDIFGPIHLKAFFQRNPLGEGHDWTDYKQPHGKKGFPLTYDERPPYDGRRQIYLLEDGTLGSLEGQMQGYHWLGNVKILNEVDQLTPSELASALKALAGRLVGELLMTLDLPKGLLPKKDPS
jgi:hypothetical protein